MSGTIPFSTGLGHATMDELPGEMEWWTPRSVLDLLRQEAVLCEIFDEENRSWYPWVDKGYDGEPKGGVSPEGA